jgi:hypothetical protein
MKPLIVRSAKLFAVLAALPSTFCDFPVIAPKDRTVASFPKIDRVPRAASIGGKTIGSLPHFDSLSGEMWQMDMRGDDLSRLDLRNSLRDLLYCDFDSRTKWPGATMLPPQFDVGRIAELGRNPGLGVRALHSRGITGKGIGIGIIDQVLLTGHREYSDRLRLYEEIGAAGSVAAMHAPAVASIAAGNTVGVAPEADIYFIATLMDDISGEKVGSLSFQNGARALWRLIALNDQLPVEKRIRVVSMSIGWFSGDEGYEEMHLACQEAKAKGIFVISSSLRDEFGFNFHALGREPLSSPDSINSYEPGLWWRERYYHGDYPLNDFLLAPMDSRTTASPTGPDDYVFYREGGWSWAIPWIAGLYALACQVNPSITPDEFWETALKTGKTIELTHDGKTYSFGKIADPQALIAALQ